MKRKDIEQHLGEEIRRLTPDVFESVVSKPIVKDTTSLPQPRNKRPKWIAAVAGACAALVVFLVVGLVYIGPANSVVPGLLWMSTRVSSSVPIEMTGLLP